MVALDVRTAYTHVAYTRREKAHGQERRECYRPITMHLNPITYRPYRTHIMAQMMRCNRGTNHVGGVGRWRQQRRSAREPMPGRRFKVNKTAVASQRRPVRNQAPAGLQHLGHTAGMTGSGRTRPEVEVKGSYYVVPHPYWPEADGRTANHDDRVLDRYPAGQRRCRCPTETSCLVLSQAWTY